MNLGDMSKIILNGINNIKKHEINYIVQKIHVMVYVFKRI